MITFQELRDDGSLITLKWVAIAMIVGALLGIMTASAKVILFETNQSGSTATFRTCVDYDYNSAKQFENQYPGGATANGVTAPDFCLRYGTETKPVGLRARQEMKLYGLIGASIGFLAGMIIGQQKHEKNQYALRLQWEQEKAERHDRE